MVNYRAQNIARLTVQKQVLHNTGVTTCTVLWDSGVHPLPRDVRNTNSLFGYAYSRLHKISRQMMPTTERCSIVLCNCDEMLAAVDVGVTSDYLLNTQYMVIDPTTNEATDPGNWSNINVNVW